MTTPAADTPPHPNTPLTPEGAGTAYRAKAPAHRGRAVRGARPTGRYTSRSRGLAAVYATVMLLAVVTAMAHGLAVEGATLALVFAARLAARRRLARQASARVAEAADTEWSA